MTIESIFDPPHYATETEMRVLFSSYKDRADLKANGPKNHDNRLLYIWLLYRLRGDAPGMAEQAARLEDPHYLDETIGRDAVDPNAPLPFKEVPWPAHQ